MMTLPESKLRAQELRKSGKSYSEIKEILGDEVSKGTLSNWLSRVILNDSQKNLIKEKMTERGLLGRYLGAESNKEKRSVRLSIIKRISIQEYEKHIKQKDFLAGLLLYLAEGTKKTERFEFMNSDPHLILFMMTWIKKYGKITEENLQARLYIHQPYIDENCEEYWSKRIDFPLKYFKKTVIKPTSHKVKKNPNYKGCLRIEVRGSELYWKIMNWQEIFNKEYQ